jgi:hypothetical protein
MEVITTHVNADFDTIGSMLAARKLYPGAVLVLPGSKEETVKGFLLQSALYALEMKKIREIDLSKVTRLILVDIRSASRIGPFRDLIGKPGVDVHVYDHHPEEDADIQGSVEVIKDVGSTTTILVEILKERNIEITPDEATVMMLGITWPRRIFGPAGPTWGRWGIFSPRISQPSRSRYCMTSSRGRRRTPSTGWRWSSPRPAGRSTWGTWPSSSTNCATWRR